MAVTGKAAFAGPRAFRAAGVVLGFFLAAGVAAQEAEDRERVLSVTRIEDSAVTVDGILEEPAWLGADVASGFTQREPVDGDPASERTEVRVLVSDEAVYVGVRAFDADPTGIVGRLSRRDDVQDTDAVTVYLDSFHDRRTAFQFTVTPRGSIGDRYSTNDNFGGDSSWDPVWQVETTTDSEGWVAEFRIPLTQLRFAADRPTWGFQVRRQIQRKAEDAYWAPRSLGSSGFTSLFGELQGLTDLPSPSRIEVRPYVVAETRRRPASSGSAYAPRSETAGNLGFDLKYGLTSDFTLDLTVNPDFGQVEADPALVNLSAFESFFPERRPFFVEGAGLFNQSVPGGQLFYSRRIGRPPQGSASPPDGGTVEVPEASTILSAAKVTGKSAGGLGLGLLSAITMREDGILRDASGAVVGEERVQPWVHHFAGRVEQDFAEGQHTVGTMATAINRFQGAEDLGLNTAAYAGIVDGRHRWDRNTYSIFWSLGASRIEGGSDAILRAQRSSFRYYQRPDAEHLGVDSTRTSLSGYSASVNFNKSAGTWRYYGFAQRTSPGLDLADMGFLFGRVDRQAVGGGASYWQLSPSGPFRNYQLYFLEWNASWTTAWENEELWIRPVFFQGNLTNNWGFNVNPIALDFGELSVNALRGGPALRQNPWLQTFGNMFSDRRKPVSVSLGLSYGTRVGTPAEWVFVNANTTVRPSPSINASLRVGYGWSRDPDQWVGRQTIAGTPRYVLAAIEQRTLDTNIRVDWTLSPTLTFQLYAQPFVAAGAYSTYKEVTSPRATEWADRFHVYGDEIDCSSGTCEIDRDGDGMVDAELPRPDFDVMSLRMTSVLRWEYMPGSVLYVAWQHGRASGGPDGTFDGLGALPDLLRLPSDNTFLVKVSYWFGL